MKTLEKRSIAYVTPGLASRADMYGFLSAAFLRPPHASVIQYMSEGNLTSDFALLYGRDGATSSRTRSFKSPDNDPAALKQEYMDLFAVPTSSYVFPFEDVYRGEVTHASGVRKGPLLGPCAVAVKTLYRQAGAQMDPACTELPTHIGVELSFMRFLCQREADEYQDICASSRTPDANDGVQKVLRGIRKLELGFLTEHLNEWFPQLSRAMQAKAKSVFYQELAFLTEQVLSWDTASLLESPELDADQHND